MTDAHTTPERLRSTGLVLVAGALSALAMWAGLSGWGGFMEAADDFTGPLAVVSLLVVAAGTLVRGPWLTGSVLRRALVALVLQLVVVTGYLHHHVTGLWRPTRESLEQAAVSLYTGGVIAREQVAPVPAEYPEFVWLMVVIGAGLILAADLIAVGIREPATAGLFVLGVVAVGASMLLDPVSAVRVVGAGAAWLALVAVTDLIRAPRAQREADARGHGVLAGTTAQVVAVSALAAVVVPLLVPASNPLADGGSGAGSGDSGSDGLRMSNPVLDLGRNLSRGEDLDVLRLRTDASTPTYLRTTVLDEFNGGLWSPADRRVSDDLRIDRAFPPPPGLATGVPTQERTWSIQVADDFVSSWLPLPYPVQEVDIDSDEWMVGEDTLDVFSTDSGTRTDGLAYDVRALEVEPTKADLLEAGAPGGLIGPELTELPDQTPEVIEQLARQVTAGSATDYERVVRLQRWFREEGDFTYSLERAPGNGLATLTRFLTEDRTGYCEQFAASMAIMARTLDIPARIAVGFLRPETSGGVSTYSTHDLHAWPEVYFEGVGWVAFEPTPGIRTGTEPTYTQGQLREDTETPETDRAPIPAPDLQQPQPQQPDAGPTATDDGGLPGWVLWVVPTLLLLLVLAVGPGALRSWRSRRRYERAREADAFADAVWAELRDITVDAGLIWRTGQTPHAVQTRLLRDLRPDATTTDALRGAVSFVELTRYGRPRDLSPETRAEVIAHVERWRTGVLEDRLMLREKWWPRSVRPGSGS